MLGIYRLACRPRRMRSRRSRTASATVRCDVDGLEHGHRAVAVESQKERDSTARGGASDGASNPAAAGLDRRSDGSYLRDAFSGIYSARKQTSWAKPSSPNEIRLQGMRRVRTFRSCSSIVAM